MSPSIKCVPKIAKAYEGGHVFQREKKGEIESIIVGKILNVDEE